MTETPGNRARGHIFISYARADGREHSIYLQEQLEVLGYACWRDERNLHRTQDFGAEIERAIEAAGHVVICITPDIRRADSFVRREIGYAQACKIPVTPIILQEDVLPPIQIINHTWVKQWHIGWKNALDELAVCFEQTQTFPLYPAIAADPFREYLQAQLKKTVDELDQRIIKLQREINLHSKSQTDAVHLALRLHVEDREFDHFNAAFDHYDGRVLLLGQPGAGKTITLLAHARDAITARLADPTQPLPIRTILSSWPAHEPPELADWLANQVDGGDGIAQQIRNGDALLLLDGLDELGGSQEEEIDGEKKLYDPRQRFLEHIPEDNQVLITCRVRDYQQIKQKAVLKGAVTLQPLTEDQMCEYLADYPSLWEAIQGDEALREMCTTPLLLSIFAFGFGESTEEERHALQNLADSPGELRDRIFGMYVERRYEHESDRVARLGKTLPYLLDEIRNVLGEAIKDRLMGTKIRMSWKEDETMIMPHNLWSALRITNTVQPFAQLCENLHYLAPLKNEKTGETGWRFAHLLLRAHLGFHSIIAALNDSDETIRAYSVDALGRLGDARAIPVLIKSLRDLDIYVRKTATVSLQQFGWQPKTKEEQVIYAIARQAWDECIHIGSPTVPMLIECLDIENDAIRIRIANALGQIGDVRAVPKLITYLEDDNENVRENIAEALGLIGDPHAVPALIVCLDDMDDWVRSHAALALGQIGDPNAVPTLIESLEDDNEYVRARTVEALGLIGDIESVPMIIECLTDEDRFVRDSASDTLASIASPQAMAALGAWLNHGADFDPDIFFSQWEKKV